MSHSSYRRLALVLPLAALLAGCGTGNSKDEETSSSSSQPAASASSETSKSTASSQNQGETPATRWSADKNQKLSAFMEVWQNGMGQTYSGTYDGQTPNHYGFKFPEALTSGRIRINNDLTAVKWTTTGEEQANWQAVAVATGHPNDRPDMLITYIFAIHNGVPTVLVTQTNNGHDLFFSPTTNPNLQDGFTSIVAGG